MRRSFCPDEAYFEAGPPAYVTKQRDKAARGEIDVPNAIALRAEHIAETQLDLFTACEQQVDAPGRAVSLRGSGTSGSVMSNRLMTLARTAGRPNAYCPKDDTGRSARNAADRGAS